MIQVTIRESHGKHHKNPWAYVGKQEEVTDKRRAERLDKQQK